MDGDTLSGGDAARTNALRSVDAFLVQSVVEPCMAGPDSDLFRAVFDEEDMPQQEAVMADHSVLARPAAAHTIAAGPLHGADAPAFARWITDMRLREGLVGLDALLRGLGDVVPAATLTLFTPEELAEFVGGRATVDIAMLRRHTEYGGSLTADSTLVKYFWGALESMTQEQLRMFVRFAWGQETLPETDEDYTAQSVRLLIKPSTRSGDTRRRRASSRDVGMGSSALGMAEMLMRHAATVGGVPPDAEEALRSVFRRRRSGEEAARDSEAGSRARSDSHSDDMRLPTADVCFFNLELPNYSSEHVLKKQLLKAITFGGGLDADEVAAN
jgi:hypothetical protein